MKNVILLFCIHLFLSSCQDRDPPVQGNIEIKGTKNLGANVILRGLRTKPEILELEKKFQKDPTFKNYDRAMAQFRIEKFTYLNEKIDKQFITNNRKNAKTIRELSIVYEKAGMKDAEKRLRNKLNIMITRSRLCEKYPKYCNLSTQEQTLLLIDNSELVINKDFLKKYNNK